MEKLVNINIRGILIIGSLEQYDDEFKIEENLEICKSKLRCSWFFVFDDMLNTTQKAFDPFCTRGPHKT